MNYKWTNDKNLAFVDPKDVQIMSELPDSVRIRIYKNFIYQSFVGKFASYFTIFKNNVINFQTKALERMKIRCIYTWQDQEY